MVLLESLNIPLSLILTSSDEIETLHKIFCIFDWFITEHLETTPFDDKIFTNNMNESKVSELHIPCAGSILVIRLNVSYRM